MAQITFILKPETGVVVAVAVAVVVSGKLWGMVVLGACHDEVALATVGRYAAYP